MRAFILTILSISTSFSLLGGCGSAAKPPAAQPTPEPAATAPEPVTPDEPAPSASAPANPASPGPVHGCTEMGCESGYSISLEPNAHWPAGKYTFDFEIDGQKGSCTGSLPLPACGTNSLKCTGAMATVGESGCALPKAEHGFSEISFGDTLVKQVSVKISKNGKQLVKKDFQPTYKHVQPNGPDCGPTCEQAGDNLKVF